MTDLHVGQRVKVNTARSYGQTMLSICGKLYMHLNSIPFITATITRIDPNMGVALRPDGWPLPEGVFNNGFWASPEELEPWESAEQHIAVITDGVGNPLDETFIQKQIEIAILKWKEQK